MASERDRRVAIVTCYGAAAGSGTSGYREAELLAAEGWHVFVASASDDGAAHDINERVARPAGSVVPGPPAGRAEHLFCDLTSLASVRAAAQSFLARKLQLHLLCLAADLSAGRAKALAQEGLPTTTDGFELCFAANALGPFLLASLLRQRMMESAPSRIVFVSHHRHAKVKGLGAPHPDWSMLQRGAGEHVVGAWEVSKLLGLLLSRRLASELQGAGVTSNCVDPGPTSSWCCAGDETAMTMYAAASPDVDEVTGEYFSRGRVPVRPSALAQDEAFAGDVWQRCETWCGVRAGASSAPGAHAGAHHEEGKHADNPPADVSGASGKEEEGKASDGDDKEGSDDDAKGEDDVELEGLSSPDIGKEQEVDAMVGPVGDVAASGDEESHGNLGGASLDDGGPGADEVDGKLVDDEHVGKDDE